MKLGEELQRPDQSGPSSTGSLKRRGLIQSLVVQDDDELILSGSGNIAQGEGLFAQRSRLVSVRAPNQAIQAPIR